jgi:hypothetical protein
MNSVTKPTLSHGKTSCDCPSRIFKIQYIGTPPPHTHYRQDCEKIELKNMQPLTLSPHQTQTIYFPIEIQTSLPGYSIIYGSDLLYRRGLASTINIMATNNSFLSTKVYNKTDNTYTFPPYSLCFNCLTIIAPNIPS